MLAVLAIATWVGCSGGSKQDEPEARADGGAGNSGAGAHTGAGSGGASGASVADPAFGVMLTAQPSARTLCPGTCVELTATADGGVAPYMFTFDHGLFGAGPHQVCPTATTTYAVTVRDSSARSEEFDDRNPDVTARITLDVDERSCSDGGASGDAGTDAGADAGVGEDVPGPPGTIACMEPIAVVADPADSGQVIDIWVDDYGPKVATAGDDVVLAFEYHGTLDLSDGTSVTSRDARSVLVAKLTSDCKPLWFTSIDGLDRGAQSPMLAVDTHGRIVVSSETSQYDDANKWLHNNIMVTGLSADGVITWSKRFGQVPGLHWQSALRIDADDGIVMLVAAAAGSDFGSGPLGNVSGLDPTIEVLFKLDSGGNHVWSTLLQEAPSRTSMAIVNGTDILFHAWTDQAQNWGAGGQTQGTAAGGAHAYLVRANADGDFVWSKRTSDGNAEQFTWHWIDAAPDGGLVLSDVASGGEIALADAQAVPVWSKKVIDPAGGVRDDWNKTLVDADGNIVVAGTFTDHTSVGGVMLMDSANVAGDAFVQKMSPDGDVMWTYQTVDSISDRQASEWLLGIAANAAGDVFASVGVSDFDLRELYLVKLAR